MFATMAGGNGYIRCDIINVDCMELSREGERKKALTVNQKVVLWSISTGLFESYDFERFSGSCFPRKVYLFEELIFSKEMRNVGTIPEYPFFAALN